MTLEPLFHAPVAVQAHVATVVPAFLLGTWLIFFSRKGSMLHRVLGATFLALMVTTAIIALFVHLRMPNSPVFGLSPTHILVIVVLFATWRALAGAITGNIRQHRIWVSGLYFGSLVINGFANVFLISGITHNIFFPIHGG
jgi:uncharacterized membrane protein